LLLEPDAKPPLAKFSSAKIDFEHPERQPSVRALV